MRLQSCIAASFAVLSVVVVPLTAQAQFQGQPRPLTPQESEFVRTFNQIMADTPNSLVRMVTDWGKADDGQMVCAALKLGNSMEAINDRVIDRTLQIADPGMQKEFLQYSNGIIVVATNDLCPEYHDALLNYIESSK